MPQNKQPKLVRISEKLQQNMQYVDELMGLETNFDIIHRVIRLGDTDACMYLIDGFCKDELMQKILQYTWRWIWTIPGRKYWELCCPASLSCYWTVMKRRC